MKPRELSSALTTPGPILPPDIIKHIFEKYYLPNRYPDDKNLDEGMLSVKLYEYEKTVSTIVAYGKTYHTHFQFPRLRKKIQALLTTKMQVEAPVFNLIEIERILDTARKFDPALEEKLIEARYDLPNALIPDSFLDDEKYTPNNAAEDTAVNNNDISDPHTTAPLNLHEVLLRLSAGAAYDRIVRILLNNGVDTTFVNKPDCHIFLHVIDIYEFDLHISKSKHEAAIRIIHLLASKGADINTISADGRTIAHQLCGLDFFNLGHHPKYLLELIQALHKNNADFSKISYNGHSALSLCVKNYALEEINYLLNHHLLDLKRVVNDKLLQCLFADNLMPHNDWEAQTRLLILTKIFTEIPNIFKNISQNDLESGSALINNLFNNLLGNTKNKPQSIQPTNTILANTYIQAINRLKLTFYYLNTHLYNVTDRANIVNSIIQHSDEMLAKDIFKILINIHPFMNMNDLHTHLLRPILLAEDTPQKHSLCHTISNTLSTLYLNEQFSQMMPYQTNTSLQIIASFLCASRQLGLNSVLSSLVFQALCGTQKLNRNLSLPTLFNNEDYAKSIPLCIEKLEEFYQQYTGQAFTTPDTNPFNYLKSQLMAHTKDVFQTPTKTNKTTSLDETPRASHKIKPAENRGKKSVQRALHPFFTSQSDDESDELDDNVREMKRSKSDSDIDKSFPESLAYLKL